MKRAQDDEVRDFDALEQDRREEQLEDGQARAEQFRTYPPGWLDGEPS